MKSLINAAKNKVLETQQNQNKRLLHQQWKSLEQRLQDKEAELYKFYIAENLQESSLWIDAWSKINDDMINPDQCQKWIRYLMRGFPDNNDNVEYHISTNRNDPFWKQLFDDEFVKNLCTKLEFKKSERFDRMKAYGKWLNKQIKDGVKLIVIGGHSLWFREFVDRFARNNIHLKFQWGVKGRKVGNGHMVDVEIKPYEKNGKKSIEIMNIEEKFTIYNAPF